MAYDDMKVGAILQQINGFDHTGTKADGVPTLFGMNFQAVSVGQKLDMTPLGGARGGYLDAAGTPSGPLQAALEHTDQSIGLMVAALHDRGLLDSTLIIITAKHGNSPINPSALRRIDPAGISTVVNSVQPGLLALLSADTGPLIWLKDQTRTQEVVERLKAADPAVTGIDAGATGQGVLWGSALAALYPDPLTDSRTPDIILLPVPGTVYTAPVPNGDEDCRSRRLRRRRCARGVARVKSGAAAEDDRRPGRDAADRVHDPEGARDDLRRTPVRARGAVQVPTAFEPQTADRDPRYKLGAGSKGQVRAG